MTLIQLALNISLLITLLIAPAALLLAYDYRRKYLSSELMSWKCTELVIITIISAITSLVFFIIGVSSFFVYSKNLEAANIISNKVSFDITVICLLMIFSITMIYSAIRILLIQVVNEKGIMRNDRFFLIPDFRKTIHWHEITDYYVVDDYPTAIFTLIIQTDYLKFERVSIRVPVYLRTDFAEILDTKMEKAQAYHFRSNEAFRNFREN